MTGNDLSNEEIREIQKNLLNIVKDICEKNKIKYSLAYGTLLGSVRHRGFIPWDDDIDIFLQRSDYERLIKILRNQSEYSWLDLLDVKEKDDYYYPFAKAIDNRTIAKMADNTTPHGIWIDIFPIDHIPDKSWKRTIFLKKCNLYRSIIISMTTDFYGHQKNGKYYVKRVLYLIANLIGKKRIANHYERFQQIYNKRQTQYVGCMSSAYINREIFPFEWFSDYIEIEFEGKSYSTIKAYDSYLRQIYGDYMILPPIEKRTEHHIKARRIE